MVTGPTASGKSTIIAGLIGEADIGDEQAGKRVTTRGTIAFVAQDAWIMNQSVRNNIIMSEPFDEARYIDTIVACELTSDLQQLAAGDKTEIGERGINLSGGQKQRIALARAAYSNRDIIVMDDPLSAVDPAVCRALVDNCICGLLAGKTRILVTHQTQFLSRADHVIAMQDCAIEFSGPFDDMPHSPTAHADVEETDVTLTDTTEQHAIVMNLLHCDTDPSKLADAARLVEAEKVDGRRARMSVLLWYLRRGGGSVVGYFVFMFLWRAGFVFADIWLAYWASKTDIFGRSYTDDEYFMYLAILLLLVILMAALRFFFLWLSVTEASRRVHAQLLGRVMYAPMSFFDTTPMGRITNRFSKDMQSVDMMTPMRADFFLMIGSQIASWLAIIAYGSVFMIPLLVIVIAAYASVTDRFATTMHAMRRMENMKRSPAMAAMAQTLQGIDTIRAYGATAFFSARHEAKSEELLCAGYNFRSSQLWAGLRMSVIGGLIALFYGILAIMMATTEAVSVVNPGNTILALGATYAAVMPMFLSFFISTYAQLVSELASVQHIQQYVETLPQETAICYGSGPDEHVAPAASWPTDGSISFKDVELRYREGKPLVLKGISFDIAAGHKVGVVGRTGSGKSTVMLALFRMVELAAGTIRIAGHDVSTLNMADLRKEITIIPQDPLLFAGTIRSNLDPFGHLDEADLWAAIDRVDLRSRMAPVESETEGTGLDTVVTEKGSNLSVGQRQLLCLARALLKKSKILLLDEATASVDFESDALIQKTIRNEFADCTVLTIAHRLATVIDADRILVLGAGEVLEYAPPSDLLALPEGHFHEMVSQLGAEQFEELKAIADKKTAAP
jgi:ABC-type multidrug transport system fused ATPase/permease subunit